MFFAEPPGGVPKAQTQATSCGTVKLARDHWDPAYAPGTPIVAKEGRYYIQWLPLKNRQSPVYGVNMQFSRHATT